MALAFLAGGARATPEKASVFYEDALKRFDRDDVDGAVIQLKNSIKEDNKLLAAHMLLGRALSRSGDLKGAEAAFEEALRQGVSRAEVALPLGRIYIALGKATMAIDRFPVSGMPPAMQVPVLAMRGTAYFELGNAREAARAFEEARRIDPNSAIPLIEEIPTLLLTGQKQRARELAARAIQLAPGSAAAWNMQASVLHDGFDLKAALAAYDKALSLDARQVDARVARAGLLFDLKREADATKDLDFLAGIADGDPRADYLRAMVAMRKGDAAAMKKHLGAAAHLLDSLPPTWLANREQLMMLAALSHHGLGNAQKAREYLDIILARNQRNDAARKLLAAIHVQGRDYGRALPILESLRATFPDDAQIQFQLGQVYAGQKRHALAIDLLEKSSARLGTPESSRALAFALIDFGRDEQAQAVLEKLVAAAPRDFESGMALATLYKRRNQPQKALAAADAMVRQAPANPSLLNFLGTIKGANGDYKGARATYEQILARNPAFRPAILNLVKLDEAEGQFDAGRKRIGAILAKQADDLDALYELGMLEKRAGRIADALKHLKKAGDTRRRDTRPGMAMIELHLEQKQAEQAVAVAKEMASKFPEDIGVQLALARSYIAQGDRGGARSVLQGATRMAEFDPLLQVTIGRMQLDAGNADAAAYNVQKALQGRVDDLGALVLAVELELQRRDLAKAEAALKTLSSRHPDRVETHLSVANLAVARAQYPAAIAAYRAALGREESTRVALGLARAHVAAGEPARGAAFLETWVKSRPGDALALKALAEAHFRAEQLPAARQAYERVLKLEPEDAPTLNNYANVLLRLNEPAALGAAEKAQRLEPDNPFYAGTLGWILVQQGKPDAGLRYLREARLRNPGNAELRYYLAVALSKTGRKAEARDELAAALAAGQALASTDGVVKLRKELGL